MVYANLHPAAVSLASCPTVFYSGGMTFSPHRPISFARFMQLLATRQSPALLWYSAPGERIELSGRVLENWVAKSANFLIDECEMDAAARFAVPLRLHWRSLVLALAGLQVGAHLTWGQTESADVRASFDPRELVESAGEDYQVAVTAEPLAPRFMGQLPEGVLDFAAEVRSHPDTFIGLTDPGSGATAWDGTGYEQLMIEVAQQAERLVAALPSGTAAVHCVGEAFSAQWLEQALTALTAGLAVLVLDPAVSWEADRYARVMADERAQPYPAPERRPR